MSSLSLTGAFVRGCPLEGCALGLARLSVVARRRAREPILNHIIFSSLFADSRARSRSLAGAISRRPRPSSPDPGSPPRVPRALDHHHSPRDDRSRPGPRGREPRQRRASTTPSPQRLLASDPAAASLASPSASFSSAAAKKKAAAAKSAAKPKSKAAASKTPAPERRPSPPRPRRARSTLDPETQKVKDAKLRALDRVLGEIDANFGKGSIMKLGTASQAKVATFPSGAMTLDIALGGGLPRGRIVEVYGPESSGKTTLALHAMAEMQKIGGNVALIDAEHAFDPEYSARLGVKVDEVIVCQPETGEMGLEVVDALVRVGRDRPDRRRLRRRARAQGARSRARSGWSRWARTRG